MVKTMELRHSECKIVKYSRDPSKQIQEISTPLLLLETPLRCNLYISKQCERKSKSFLYFSCKDQIVNLSFSCVYIAH